MLPYLPAINSQSSGGFSIFSLARGQMENRFAGSVRQREIFGSYALFEIV
jgi:hypothetical protein